ncbi:MAG: hypothetical protein HY779_05805 [Rubrobacteridae bacterium]|nr:hypothetical protein [Rubrobacteridae bacterium]
MPKESLNTCHILAILNWKVYMYPSRYSNPNKRYAIRTIICTTIALCLALTPVPAFSIDAIAGLNVSVTPTVDEQSLLDSLNKERVKNGMAALKSDPKLQLMARTYSREMISESFFGHVSPVSGDVYKRFSNTDIRKDWIFAGENLAISPTVEIAHEILMESPKHKANILEPKYTHIGIGIVDGPNGKVIVQEFATYPQEMQPIAVLQTANELLILAVGWIANVVPISI